MKKNIRLVNFPIRFSLSLFTHGWSCNGSLARGRQLETVVDQIRKPLQLFFQCYEDHNLQLGAAWPKKAEVIHCTSKKNHTKSVYNCVQPSCACVRCVRRRSVSGAWRVFAALFLGWDTCHLHSPSLFLDCEECVGRRSAELGRHCHVRACLSTARFRSLANNEGWSSLHCSDPKPLLWSKGNKFLGFPWMTHTQTLRSHTAESGQDAPAPSFVKGRWDIAFSDDLLNKHVLVDSFGFANCTNTFMHAKETQCTLPWAKPRLWESFWTVSLQTKLNKKRGEVRPVNYRAYRDSARLGRLGFGLSESQARPFFLPSRADGQLFSKINQAVRLGNLPSKIFQQPFFKNWLIKLMISTLRWRNKASSWSTWKCVWKMKWYWGKIFWWNGSKPRGVHAL